MKNNNMEKYVDKYNYQCAGIKSEYSVTSSYCDINIVLVRAPMT